MTAGTMKKMLTANEHKMINGGAAEHRKPIEILVTRPGPTRPLLNVPDPDTDPIRPRLIPDKPPFKIIEAKQTGHYL